MTKLVAMVCGVLTCLSLLVHGARAQHETSHPEPERGSLTAELAVGALAGTGGALLIYTALGVRDDEHCIGSHDLGGFGRCEVREHRSWLGPLLTLGIVAPLMTSSAVWAAGLGGRGQGRLPQTLAGSYLLGGAGALFGLFASTLIGSDTTVDRRVFVPLAALGMTLGAVLGYRLSAPEPRVLVSPALSRDGLSIQVVGAR